MSINEKSASERRDVWQKYISAERENPERKRETEEKKMYFGDVFMKYEMFVIGEPGENGYPVYIALHGGGHSDTPDMNDSQWEHMKIYYRESVRNGIYIAPRGVRDTWDTHANPESFPLYDRLIENMIIFYNADPNKVYILGFSAGGDGTYLTTPVMADRFAAANMSAGCPNGISLKNLRNMPILLQAGERDLYFRRNYLIAEYDAYLTKLCGEYGGYDHNAYIHFDRPHNYRDNDPERKKYKLIADNKKWLAESDRTTVDGNPNAIDYLDTKVRNPLPDRVVWELSKKGKKRSVNSFYWLSSPDFSGEIVASVSKADNSVTIEKAEGVKQFSVLINEEMLDLDKEIKIKSADGFVCVSVNLCEEEIAEKTTAERGDPNYIFCGEIKFAAEC